MTKPTVENLYSEFKQNIHGKKISTRKFVFSGIKNNDVYNITAPFKSGGKKIILGRVEGRDTEFSHAMFFEEKNNIWSPVENAPVLALQDPCVAQINSELVVGGVEVFNHPTLEGCLWWKMVFYRGPGIFTLQKFAEGPNGMKDIRLVGLDNNRIGIFTRPQHPEGVIGSLGGRGKIGYVEIDRLEDVNAENIEKAQILDQISDDNWLGANEIHRLNDGKLGVLSHVAMYDSNKDRHYYPSVFKFDPKTRTPSPIRIIAERSMFLPGPAKRPDLTDVVFSGGLLRKPDNKAELYVGTSDAEAQMIEFDDPFAE